MQRGPTNVNYQNAKHASGEHLAESPVKSPEHRMWSWLNTASRPLERYGSSPVVLGDQNNEGNLSIRGGAGQDGHYPEGRSEIERERERGGDREEGRMKEKSLTPLPHRNRDKIPRGLRASQGCVDPM